MKILNDYRRKTIRTYINNKCIMKSYGLTTKISAVRKFINDIKDVTDENIKY